MADVSANKSTTATMQGEAGFIATYSGTLDFYGDKDWVKVFLTAGLTYSIYGSATGIGQAGGDSVLRLYDPAGTKVAEDDQGGVLNNSLIAFAPTVTGYYFVDVSTYENLPADYSLAITGKTGTDKKLTEFADTHTGLAGEKILGGLGDDNITLGAATLAFGEQGEDSIFGNNLVNMMSGGQGNDYLAGFGGNDLLYGDTGNDRIDGGSDNDKIFGDSGFDSLRGSDGKDYISGGGDADELAGGIEDDTLNGDEGDDQLYGENGNDLLKGGTGKDYMSGGSGNDTFYVDIIGDTVIEGIEAASKDTVFTSVSYTLAAGVEIETFGTASVAGTGAINLTGNEFAQRINGNNGNNILKGAAGADKLYGYNGNDTLYGGTGNDLLQGMLGADKFLFYQSKLAVDGKDNIVDFSATDRIYFDVTSGPTGTLAAANFKAGTAAGDSSDRFIYDSKTGNLFFDSNGNGAGGQVHIAVLDNKFALNNTHIFLF